jgi:serine/threonine protein kinase
MSAPPSERDPLDILAEEYVERFRRGERPTVAEYARRHPELAGRIRELFPALILMERLGPAPGADPPRGPGRLGEYRIVREIGRGGMGVVYEAVQESLGRRVALKVLPAERCRGQFLERFWREARAAARLHHTNIVPVFGVGQDGGTHYYVMQYIDGRGLDRLLCEVRQLRGASTGPHGRAGDTATADEPSELARSLLTGQFPGHPPETPPPDRPAAVAPADGAYYRTVARLGLQAAEALEHAHAQGVLHRDVKPSNLLLDSLGTLWVADFGLAKAADGKDLTHTDDLVGTLRYMAPERFRGQADARSDVYSLGATLYELLALCPALDGPDRLQLMDRIAHGTPAPLRQIDPSIPRDLETVVGKAMAREPRDRYATARALAEDLERFLADRPIRARRAGLLEQALRWRKRHPAVAALSAAVVFLLAFSAGGGWWAAAKYREQVATVSRAERDTTDRLWEARLAQARAGRASRLPGQRFKSLEALAEAARIRPSRELRDEAIACLALVDVQVERQWPEDIETDRLEYSTGVAFDAGLEHYAFSDGAGAVHVRSAEDGRELARLGGGAKPAETTCASARTAATWPPATRTTRGCAASGTGAPGERCWSWPPRSSSPWPWISTRTGARSRSAGAAPLRCSRCPTAGGCARCRWASSRVGWRTSRTTAAPWRRVATPSRGWSRWTARAADPWRTGGRRACCTPWPGSRAGRCWRPAPPTGPSTPTTWRPGRRASPCSDTCSRRGSWPSARTAACW